MLGIHRWHCTDKLVIPKLVYIDSRDLKQIKNIILNNEVYITEKPTYDEYIEWTS